MRGDKLASGVSRLVGAAKLHSDPGAVYNPRYVAAIEVKVLYKLNDKIRSFNRMFMCSHASVLHDGFCVLLCKFWQSRCQDLHISHECLCVSFLSQEKSVCYYWRSVADREMDDRMHHPPTINVRLYLCTQLRFENVTFVSRNDQEIVAKWSKIASTNFLIRLSLYGRWF